MGGGRAPENAAGIVKSCAAGMCFSLVRGSIPVRTGPFVFWSSLLAQIASNFANDYFDFKREPTGKTA